MPAASRAALAALLLLFSPSPSLALAPGTPLRLAPCAAARPGALLEARAGDGTLRSADGALCATFVGPSPAQLQLQPCASGAGAEAQRWAFNAAASAVEGTVNGSCLALNTQGDTTVPTRPVSTWACGDLEWNGLFHLDGASHLVANCSTPACGGPDFCVAGDDALGRVLSLSTVVRYWTVETTRTDHILGNESAIHTVAACTAFRAAVSAGWPGASISWAFSFDALTAEDGEYPAIRALVAGYVASLGDEMTFNPGGYFAPMYNNETQTNLDIHDALVIIGHIVGGGYRPKAIIAGYLGAQTLKYLAEVEDIHVAQATIFSQFNIDFGDGDGG